MGPAHLELEVLAGRGHQGGAAQPQHHQHRQEEAAGQDPARKPRAPAPPSRHVQGPWWDQTASSLRPRPDTIPRVPPLTGTCS